MMLAFGCCLAPTTWAQQLRTSPAFIFLTGEPGARALLRVSTEGTRGIFVDAQLHERLPDGTLLDPVPDPSAEGIALVPPQTYLQEGEGKAVYLEWQGARLEAGRVFVLFFDQIEPRQRSHGVDLQVSLGTVIVVNPPAVPAEPASMSLEKQEGGFAAINPGSRVHVIGRGTLVATDASGAVCTLGGDALLATNADTYVYPHSIRRFFTDDPCIAGAVSLTWRQDG